MSLPDTVARFVAETRTFDGPVDDSARKVSSWGRATERASLQARKALLSASEAADKAAKSQLAAKAAADKLAKGEINESEAAKAAASAARDLERASIAQREAQIAARDAAERAARQYRQEARDAQLAATAQMLGALKAKGSVEQYNSVLRQAKVIHGDLSKTALAGFKQMEVEGNATYTALTEASSGLGEANKLWVVGIANGLMMLPGLAGVAADAVTLGLGGAIAAVGLKFAAQNKEVRAEYSSLGHDIFTGLSHDAQPFVHTLDDIARQGRASFASWQPEIRSIWADMAPAVDTFVTTAIRDLDEFKPALESITRGFDAQLSALGSQTGSIMHNLATGVGAIGDAAARNPQALAQMVNDVSLLVRYTGDGIGTLIRYKDEFSGFVTMVAGVGPMGLFHLIDGVSQLGKDLGITGHGLTVAGGNFASFSQQSSSADASTNALSQDMDKLASTTASAADKANALTDAFTRLLDPEKAVFDDSAKLRDQITQLTAALKTSHGALNDNSAAGRAAKESFTKVLTSAEQMSTDMLNAGDTITTVQHRLVPYIDSMYKAAGANKQARALVDEFVRSLSMVPPKKGTTITVPGATSARAQIEALQRSITDLHGRTVTVDYIETVHRTIQAERARATGGYVGYAAGGAVRRYYPSGGPVSGPGTSTSDSIPAMLSNGEYVINAAATRRYRGLLDQINYGLDGASGGSSAPAGSRFLSSGRVGTVQHVTNVNVTVHGSVVAQRQLVEVIRQGLAQRSVYNPGNGASIPRRV